MSRYVRKADLEAARAKIRIAPGPHHPREVCGGLVWALLNSGMSKVYSPAERKRWAEIADELERRHDAAERWGYRPKGAP